MNQDTLRHMSSLMDGELSHETGLFVARRMSTDVELGGAWTRYHLIRECLRRPGGRLVLSGLRQEEGAWPGSGFHTAHAPLRRPRWIRPVAGFAIAASVAMVAILLALPPGRDAARPAEVRTQPFTSPNPISLSPISQPASFSGAAGNQRLNSYLLRHNQVAGSVGRQGFVSLVPIVTTTPVQVLTPVSESAPPAPDTSEDSQTRP